MRSFFVLLGTFGIGLYLSISTVTYFVLGDEVAKLPLHQRLGPSIDPVECGKLAESFNQRSPSLHSKCETLPLGIYIFEVTYNIVDQPWSAAIHEFLNRPNVERRSSARAN